MFLYKRIAAIITLSIGVIFFNQLYAENHPESNMELFLEIMVNHVSTQHIALVDYRHPYYYMSLDDLRETPIILKNFGDISTNKEISVNAHDDVQVDYDEAFQRLNIIVPSNWLPEQSIGYSRNKEINPKNSLGLIINYDIYTTKPQNNNVNTNIWTEFRSFGDYGILSNSGVYSQSSSNHTNNANRYIRYDTYWQYSDEKRMLTTIVGDFITRPLSWSNAARLGGIQFSHNFSMRPDIITYPLPEFRGEVGLPSTVDLIISGQSYQKESVNPGPFAINDVSHLSGRGNAVIVTTDALGRTVSVDIPFYVTSQLLRKGLLDYTVSIGSIRKYYGQKNFSYGQFAVDSSLRYGLNDELTIEAHAELAPSLQVIGAGFVTNFGRIGVINTAYMLTQHKGNIGNQLYLGYEYNEQSFNFSARYTKRNKFYKDISTIDSVRMANKETLQLTLGRSFEEFGNVSLGFFSHKTIDNQRDNLASFGWSNSLNNFGSVFAYVNKSIGKTNDQWSASLQWLIPLDPKYGSLSTSANHDSSRNQSYSLSYSRSVPSDGGFGWSLSYDFDVNASDYYSTYLKWSNDYLETQGGIYGNNQNKTYWINTSGSIVTMDKQFFAAKKVHDSFVLVSTTQTPNVPIIYENKMIGSTNSNGYFLISQVPAYYNTKIEIDPLNIPLNLQAEDIEQSIAIKAKSGYLIEFPIKKINAATLILMDEFKSPIPIGSLVLMGDEEYYVGWDGVVYLEHLQERSELIIYLPDDKICHASIEFKQLSSDNEAIPDIGEQICSYRE